MNLSIQSPFATIDLICFIFSEIYGWLSDEILFSALFYSVFFYLNVCVDVICQMKSIAVIY